MSNLALTLNTGTSSIYLQHPKSARLAATSIIPGTSSQPVEVSDRVSFIYDQLEKPQTRVELTPAFLKQFSSSMAEGEAFVALGALLRVLVERAIIVEIPPGSTLPADEHGCGRHLLWKAQQRLRAADWSSAIALCQEAAKDPAFGAVAELDILIARYQGGSIDGLVEQACMLSCRLIPPAQFTCDAVALLAAHRSGDLATVRRIAVHLAQRIESPFDLPTVPDFAVPVRNQIVVLEAISVQPMLAAIEDVLAARVASSDDATLLVALANRYRDREREVKK